MTGELIRDATLDDADQLNEIYNQYIVDSHVSFDTIPWTQPERESWLESRFADGYPVLVIEHAGSVVGASWSGPWRNRAAYRVSVETTVVVDPRYTHAGRGTELLSALLARLRTEGFHRAYAIVALPNEASVRVHKKVGFTEIGVLDEAGHKGGVFVSTMLLEKRLA